PNERYANVAPPTVTNWFGTVSARGVWDAASAGPTRGRTAPTASAHESRLTMDISSLRFSSNDGSDLDRTAARRGNPRRKRDRFVEILRLDDEVADEVFLG